MKLVENVVYLLGAGFSQPVGLPLIGNFLEKAKDLEQAEPGKHNLRKIIEAVGEMHATRTHCKANFEDIEEVLSVLEMQAITGRQASSISPEDFTAFIRTVIGAYTPEIELPEGLAETGRWGADQVTPDDCLVARGSVYRHHVPFVVGLLGFRIVSPGKGEQWLYYEPQRERERRYNVVTLNYDLVIERCLQHLGRFLRDRSGVRSAEEELEIIHLHGSIAHGPSIVPPTSLKALHPGLRKMWRRALTLLAEANHIRILGYSLPDNDSYIRYLLKAAACEAQNLKRIDVLCLDDNDGTVKKRYDGLFESRGYQFINGRVETYLMSCMSRAGASGWTNAHGANYWDGTLLDRRHERALVDAGPDLFSES